MFKHARTIAAGVAATLMISAYAETGVAQTKYRFDVSPQPLGKALNVFAAQTGLNIYFDPSAIAGMESPALNAELTPEDALGHLLNGSRLKAVYVDEHTIRVMPENMAPKKTAHDSVAASTQLAQTQVLMRLAQTESPEMDGKESRHEAAGENELQLEEVIVTAQKREERLQDVPLSIGVLSGTKLDEGSSRNVSDVLNQIGGVSISSIRPGDSTIAIRGVSGSIASSPTGYYLDELPFAFIRQALAPDASSYDLARIEVLRGPQGTLYGANAIGGVVRVLTNDADLDAFAAKGRLRVSDTKDGGTNFSGDAAVNIPLVQDKLAVRLVAGHADQSGYINSSFDGGKHINDTTAQNYRAKINFQPSDDLNIKFGYTRSVAEIDHPNFALPDVYTTPLFSDAPTKQTLNTFNLIVGYDWPGISLMSSTGYIDNTYLVNSPIALGANGSFIPVYLNSYLDSFSQELRLTSRNDGSFNWSLGGYYRDARERNTQDARASVFQPNFSQVYRIKETSESYAVFGEVTQAFADGKLEATGGLRYFHDTYGQSQQANFAPGPVAQTISLTFDKLTWRALLKYKPSADMTFYGSVSTGFRSGIGQTPATLIVAPNSPKVAKPDALTNYELGAKGYLFGDAVTYELAGYYLDWKDIPQSLVLPGTNFGTRVNAASATGPGAEATLTIRPTRQITLNASIGWNDLHFVGDTTTLVANAPVVILKDGERPNDSPEWTASTGADYRTASGMSDVDFIAGASFVYSSVRQSRVLAATPFLLFSGETNELKAHFGLRARNWSLELYGDNLLDSRSLSAPPYAGYFGAGAVPRPRTIGLQTTFDF